MRTPGPVLPTKAADEAETPNYLSSADGNWVFDKETGSFVWVPTDKLGQQFNQNSPILQEPAPRPVVPQRYTDDNGSASKQ